MREALTDILKHTSSLFEMLIIDGSDKETTVKAMDKEKTIIFQAKAKEVLSDFDVGQSTMSNLGLLKGLLEFPSYNTEAASLTVKRGTDRRTNSPIVEEIGFKDSKGGGATYRLGDIRMIKDENRPPQVSSIPWELEFEPNRSNLDEFIKLTSLYNEVDKLFCPRTVNGNLQFSLGVENSSTHRASMVFEEGVNANIKGDAKYSTDAFLSILKLASAHPTKLHMSSRGVLMVSFETAHACYEYIIRAQG